MKFGVLFSGGKDSAYSMYLAKKAGHEIACLITLHSENKGSYMFHTPSIEQTEKQAEVLGIPLMVGTTKGIKEKELEDLTDAIKSAIKKYHIEGIVTGALHSVYQASRIQKICDNLGIQCLNPLWHRDEIEYLRELIENKFKVMIIGVAAYPLDNSWLGRTIDDQFIEEVKILKQKYNIHPAGEGGEFETFVLKCPMFRKELKIISFRDIKEGENAWRREIEVD